MMGSSMVSVVWVVRGHADCNDWVTGGPVGAPDGAGGEVGVLGNVGDAPGGDKE